MVSGCMHRMYCMRWPAEGKKGGVAENELRCTSEGSDRHICAALPDSEGNNSTSARQVLTM